MRRLICTFVVRIWQKNVFTWPGPFTISDNVISRLTQMGCKVLLDEFRTVTETRNCQRARPRVPTQYLQWLTKQAASQLQRNLQCCFSGCGRMRLSHKNSRMQLYYTYTNGKGNPQVCDIQMEIFLLPITRKILDTGRPEETDMIFAVRQLQEKYQEHKVDLNMTCVDRTKVFDTVSLDGRWTLRQSLAVQTAL